MIIEDLELPSGETVAVRGLTGMEVALIAKRNAQLVDDPDAPGGTAIQIGFMLGKTRVRDAEAAGVAWLNGHGAADFAALGNAIERLSGFGQGAKKALWIEQQATDEGAWYAVAEALGGRTVAELKSTMDHREFLGWVVYLNNKADDAKHGR